MGHKSNSRRGLGSCSALYNAMRKHGEENFSLIVLESGISHDLLDEREIFFIGEFNTLSPEGYNLTAGGLTCPMTPETKEKLSRSLSGRILSSEWKKKISKRVKKLWEDPEYRKGQVKTRYGGRKPYGKVEKPLRLELDTEDIVRRYNSGETINSIATDLGVSFSAVSIRLPCKKSRVRGVYPLYNGKFKAEKFKDNKKYKLGIFDTRDAAEQAVKDWEGNYA